MNNQIIIPLFVAGSLLLTLFGFFLIAYLLVQKRKQNNYQLEKQRMVFDHQNHLLRTKIEEQENTMDQISKELHDNVKSILGFAQMNLANVAATIDAEEKQRHVNTTNNALTKVIEEVHNISHSLNSNFVKHIGLVETIGKELENTRLSKNVACNMAIKGTPISLTPEKELHIYRIAQEAIHNSMKHAKATKLDLTLDFEPDFFTMKIEDNGVGFDKGKVFSMKGLGFLNMFQRARYVHGALDVQTTPMEGSTITFTLNLYKNGISN